MADGIIPAERVDWFWSRVARVDPDGCWPWLGYRNREGYGQASFRMGGKQTVYIAHRLAYELVVGSAKGLVLMHSCDNRACCNPAHLVAGTQADNLRDMASKGRSRGMFNAPRLGGPTSRLRKQGAVSGGRRKRVAQAGSNGKGKGKSRP